MNALALVCNLYADGPRSLQRLREDGRHELEDVLGLSVGQLVELLGMSRRAAERFLREAETLGRRVGSGFLDPEAEGDLHPSATADAEEALGALVPDVLDGLDASTCERLHAAGVVSLAQLGARDTLEVASAADLPFAGVRRLQFLARRLAGPAAAPRATAGIDEVIPAPRAASPEATRAAGRTPHGGTPAAAGAKVSLADGPRAQAPTAFEEELSERARGDAAGPFA